MRILVDADACPVKDIIVQTAKEYNLQVIMFIDTSHELADGYSKVVVVDKGKDSVDFALIANTQKNDIIITQDYGLAALALARQCFALNPDGLIYNADNIQQLLYQRHMNQRLRQRGKRPPRIKKRTPQQDIAFKQALIGMIEGILNKRG